MKYSAASHDLSDPPLISSAANAGYGLAPANTTSVALDDVIMTSLPLPPPPPAVCQHYDSVTWSPRRGHVMEDADLLMGVAGTTGDLSDAGHYTLKQLIGEDTHTWCARCHRQVRVNYRVSQKPFLCCLLNYSVKH